MMTPEEISQEISGLQKGVEERATRIHALAQAIQHQVRRAPVDDNTSIYISYAKAWDRFAGLVSQGSSRTASINRLLKTLAKPDVVRKPIEKPVIKTAIAVQVPEEETTPMEDLLAIYHESEDEGDDA